MTWKPHVRRVLIETLILLVVLTAAVYFLTEQDSLVSALGLGAVAAVLYSGSTFLLRRRALKQRRDHR